MSRLLNPDRYSFKWLATEIIKREMTVNFAANKIDVTTGTIYNWLTGMYLRDAISKPNIKDDVATKIANLLDIDSEEARYQIKLYLKSTGKLVEFDENETFKSAVATFISRVEQISYYDVDIPITPQQRELIMSVLGVLNKI